MMAIDQLPAKKRLPLGEEGEIVLIDTNEVGLSRMTGPLEPERNVFLVNSKGQIVWQIEAAVKSHGAVGYSDVYLGESNNLLAYSSNGIEYSIDKVTGCVLGKELIR